MTYTNLHLAIGMKLGWGEMPASVAIPAINKIIEVSGIYHVDFVDMFRPYELFLLMGSPASLTHLTDFLNLRWEIEQEMFNGSPYWVAIDKWFK
jgi:hypothetical protein